MFDILQGLVSAKQHVQENPGASVTISLPLDDPRAQLLAKFARKLMIPTTKIRASGLTTRTGIASPNNAVDFLEELRKTVGDELFNELMTDLGGQVELSRQQKVDTAMSSPGFLANAVHTMGKSGLLADLPLREKLVNVADEVLRKNP